MGLQRFFAAQARKPSGLLGSMIVARAMNKANQRLVNIAIELLDLRPGDAVLDIGFGGGQSLVAMAGRVTQGLVAGVDYSPEMVARAGKRIRRLGLDSRVKLCLGDAARLPFRDQSFDRVITANTIYFWPDLGAGLREIARVTKSRGRLAIAMRSRACMARWSFTRHGFTLYEPQEVAAAMTAAGFPAPTIDHRDRGKSVDNVVVLGERA
jgi:ubiquinone/menaquinone biosynthesis C-methylase UbiE